MERPKKKELIAAYRAMVRIRSVEEKLMEVFSNGEIPGFIHVCIGQEATPVALCSHLKASDYLATTHRGHGHALAKGIDVRRFMAELFGRRNGPCRGRSGSMHLAEAGIGLLGANGIVGGGIPIAVGASFAAKYRNTGQVTACCFGEGATGEGVFHESVNLASLRKLPIVFVCENNGWAEFTPQGTHMPIRDVAGRAAAYGIPGVVASNEYFDIHEKAGAAVEQARAGGGPTLLEVKSRRWHGHFVGDAQKYRPPQDVDAAKQDDCIAGFEARLLRQKVLRKEDPGRVREEIRMEIEEAVEFARNSPFPDPSELLEDLYA